MATEENIRVIIVDDNDHVRMGLSIVLENFDDITLVGEAASGQEAIELCTTLEPDVVLMDLIMPQMDGITATRLIHEKYPSMGIVVLTSNLDPEARNSAFQAGASSFMLKVVGIDEIATAIRTSYQST